MIVGKIKYGSLQQYEEVEGGAEKIWCLLMDGGGLRPKGLIWIICKEC